ncbi:MAG: response regulator [Candidatus Acidiferrum sp.]
MAKILVADDNSNIQKMVGLALKDQGIDVVAVGNGEAAVRKISDIRPDLVLADVFMPVRNGYEVCRYVKEDSSLAHIPVILLVGAFDPLDEQEAQRVGADGVLKKPFVPPDPLIAMVKSALIRAGVPLGPAPKEQAPPAPPPRSTAEILNAGVSSKLAALSSPKLPDAIPEPLEELPISTPHLKIAAGSEPLAFGSLLTPDTEDAATTAKPMIDLSAKKWLEDTDGVEEEKEEEEEIPHGGWRPGGLDETLEQPSAPAHTGPDWREEAFHGNPPADPFSSNHWAASLGQPQRLEAAESQSIAVATETAKPLESPAPFTSDAWTAAMTGMEEKIAELRNAELAKAENETAPEIQAGAVEHIAQAETPVHGQPTETLPAVEPAHVELAAEPANWAAVPETAWELEAKKAAQLASTWDAPKSLGPDDTQEIPAYSSEAAVEHSETATTAFVEHSPYLPEPIPEPVQHVPETEVSAPEASQNAEAIEPKSWENAWEAPAVPHSDALTEHVHAVAADTAEQLTPAAAETDTAAANVNMDELVANVLKKMDPEVLQKVTREILKPVIGALVRAEIENKKS